jgi:hypothetical protein
LRESLQDDAEGSPNGVAPPSRDLNGYTLPPLCGTGLKFGYGPHRRRGTPDDGFDWDIAEGFQILDAFRPILRDADEYRPLRLQVGYYVMNEGRRFRIESRQRALFVTNCDGQMFKFGPLIGEKIMSAFAGDISSSELSDWAAGRVQRYESFVATHADIIVFGTGSFAGRIICDIAATAATPVRIVIAGRNVERMNWLKLAANARAKIFGRPAAFTTHPLDLAAPDAVEAALAEYAPPVVVQAASSQPASVIAGQADAWSRLVAEGGLSATAVFQARLSARVARAIQTTRPTCRMINCCFPDVVNSILAAMALPIDCGVGNVAILANAFAGEFALREPRDVRVLAPYQTITPWRRPPEARTGPAARVWIDNEEVADIFATFASVKITPEPAIEISGASGVPLMLAMATARDWRGHAPGPNGLPGGYPVAFRDAVLDLDLPLPIDRAEAIAWNASFEEANGMKVGANGFVSYTGVLYERMRKASADLARGFHVSEIEDVHQAMLDLRARLLAQPVRA